MKKFFTIALMAILAVPAINAQESMFNLGDKVVNLGIGIGSTLYSYSSYYSRGVPPVSISFEQGIKDDILENGVIGVGGYLGYSSSKYRYTWLGGEWGWNYSYIVVGALGTFHYPILDNLDTYVGVLLGYNITTSREVGDVPLDNDSHASGGIVYSGFVGARYYFNDKFAVFGQLGYGIAYLTLGLSIKL